jgi:DNA repair protein RadA/Sms
MTLFGGSEPVSVAKARAVFFCSDCGYESTRWLGRCPGCAAWNTLVEAPAQRPQARTAVHRTALAPVRLADVDTERAARVRTGMSEFDAVLGGGVVPGSLILIGGPPGAGKSTLLLQVAQGLAKTLEPVVYVSGEESAAQTKLRAQRLGIADDVLVYAETDLRAILDDLEKLRPRLLIVDSIQTVWLSNVESAPGSVGQIRECAQALLEFAKRSGCPTFIVGHVTKEGAIAGPRLLEHLVDTVLYFEGEQGGEFRIIRAYKNRFGSAEEICVFEMGERGLREIANPSTLFLSGRAARPSGSCVVPSLVGSRPILVEVQALVGEAAYGTPRRLAANLDAARLAMIIAVLERRVGMALGSHDVYASVAGGLRINEPAADLGIALAIASAFRGVPLAADATAFGEIGLAGEVRAVGQSARRAAEARKLGFSTVFAPPEIVDLTAAIRAALA